MTAVRAVIFDLDDTLFDDAACTQAGLRALAGAYPCDWPEERVFARHAEIIRDVDPVLFRGEVDAHGARVLRFTQLLTDLGHADPDGEAATHLYRRAYREAWTACDAALDVVRALRSRELRLAILTNYVREVQEEKAASLGLLPFVDALLCVDDLPAPKPDPRAYLSTCDCLDVRPEDTVMIGASWENDVQGARNAGLRAVRVNRHGAVAPDTSVPVIRDLRELPDLLLPSCTRAARPACMT